MKTFRQFIREAMWRPITGKEKQREFHPAGGEIASQVRSHEMAIKAKEKGQTHVEFPDGAKAPVDDLTLHPAVHRAMKSILNNRKLLNKKLMSKRESYSKNDLKTVRNTTGSQSWSQAKSSITPERVARAEINRQRVQTSPTILRVKDSSGKTIEHNVGGNTRLSSMADNARAKVHVIDMSKGK
jgi:hypothetical protein